MKRMLISIALLIGLALAGYYGYSYWQDKKTSSAFSDIDGNGIHDSIDAVVGPQDSLADVLAAFKTQFDALVAAPGIESSDRSTLTLPAGDNSPDAQAKAVAAGRAAIAENFSNFSTIDTDRDGYNDFAEVAIGLNPQLATTSGEYEAALMRFFEQIQ